MITPINIEDIPARTVKGERCGLNKQDVLDFVKSDALAAEVSILKGKTAKRVAQCYAVAAKRVGGVAVVRRGDRVFLVKEGADA